MSRLTMKKLSTEEILSGLNELKAGMKKDPSLDKKFTAILEDSERRIKSCEWKDFTKVKSKDNVKCVFKLANYTYDNVYIKDFFEAEEHIKKNCEEDGWEYTEGELFWKPLETEHEIDLKEVWDGLFELYLGINEEEGLKIRYSDIIDNIMERVNSGKWFNFRGYQAAYRLKVIYKALYHGDWWRYGASLYDPNADKIIAITMPELCESIWWKPLEIENIV